MKNHPLARKPIVTVGGGRVHLPGLEGAGHTAHAVGILEGLRAHPDVQTGKVIVQEILANTYELDRPPEHMYSDVVVTAGFSGLPGDYDNDPPKGFVPKSKEKHDNYNTLKKLKFARRIPFAVDAVREENAPLAPEVGFFKRSMNSLRNYLAKRLYYRDAVLYGHMSFPVKSFLHYEMAASVTEATLAGIRAAHQETDAAKVYREFATSIEAENPEGAQYIHKGIDSALANGNEYRAIMVTGSSRGDYVAKKTLDFIDTLKGTAEENLYQIIPILGSNINITGQLLDGSGIPRFGSMPLEMYTKLRGIATLNLASSGSNDLTGMYLLPTCAMIPTPAAMRALRAAEIELLGDKITPEQRTALKQSLTDVFNLGNLQGLSKAKPHGMKLYSDPLEILTALRDLDFMDKAKCRARAERNLKLAIEAKADLANHLVEAAYLCAQTIQEGK